MAIKINVSDFRNPSIEMYNLRNVNENYTFYYDETNNIRKLYLTEDGVNASEKDYFVIGGIVHKNNNIPLDRNFLFQNLNLQKSVKEIKLKHIAKGDFINCLKSKKLNILLKWLLEHDLYFHYSNLNIFYWSIIDIVDSALTDTEFIYLHFELKSELFKLININRQSFFDILYTYSYPNIKRENLNDFVKSILDFIQLYKHKLENNNLINILEKNLEKALDTGELIFIMNEKNNILISDLSQFYLRPIYMFKNSKHIFDEELFIQKIINEIELYDSDDILENYTFIQSNSEIMIQISDVLVGLMGKYFSFINSITIQEINTIKSTFNKMQNENFQLFKELIIKSDKESNAFIHSIMSIQL